VLDLRQQVRAFGLARIRTAAGRPDRMATPLLRPSTPTTRLTRSGEAAAMPISLAISCVGSPVTGVLRSSG